MRIFKTTTVAAALLLFGAAGCADLDVQNPNDPDREQALATALDVESLIAGSYNTWYNGLYHWTNTFWVSNASFQSISTAANAGNVDHSTIPRVPITNDAAYAEYHGVVERSWQRSYRALAAVADGLRSLDEDPELGAELDAEAESGEGELRVRAFGKTIQALAHATIAVWYDQGFVVDETTDLTAEQPVQSYDQVMEAAYGYFDEAIGLATGANFTIPSRWMSQDVPADELVEMLYSWRAIFRASLPRTPDEDVNWNAVLSDLDNGLSTPFIMDADWTDIWYNGAFDVGGGPNGWGADVYFVIGMADQSGSYQTWLADPVADRTAWFGGNQDDDPFLIITPDTRFPQGSTIADQEANPGDFYVIPREETWNYDVAEHFTRPARGTWRWSYYYNPTSFFYWFGVDMEVPMITTAELDMLRAEAIIETDGNLDEAAALINNTREAHGLAGTDAAGTNADCVPKLPNEECGDLMEMMKWEKRLETRNVGLFGIGWYWDGRRWGDLYRGTPLQWPIPAGELETLQMPHYTFGGVNESPPSAAATSSYNYPHEGS